MELERNHAIKVLGVDPHDGSLRSCHGGGRFQWDPPTLNEDGTYTPGAWTPPVHPNLCHHGYHLTDDPSKWWGPVRHFRAYLVEFRGYVDGKFTLSEDRKISVESCRLLRPLTADEMAPFNIFLDGEHVIDSGYAYAYGNAKVHASRYVKINAFGKSTVWAKDYVWVYAYDNSSVHTEGQTNVFAYDDTMVNAGDGGFVTAFYRASVTASKNVLINTSAAHSGVITRTMGEPSKP